ncbi:vWA domain-containing protein [Nannocystaceae bacterium ST9]
MPAMNTLDSTPARFSLCARTLGLAALLATATLAGCSSDAGYSDEGFSDEGGNGLDPGVGQGGAQDFGLFREILLEGGIPGPETIDDLGFFAEHKVDMPEADCGENVCIHGLLGVMGNMITGSNCTVVMVGMNTPIDPNQVERPPLNLTIAVDLSSSMQGPTMEHVREGLLRMREGLEPDDRVTIVGFSDGAEVLVEQVAGESGELAAVIAGLTPSGNTNIYAGLRTAYELTDAWAQEGWQNRVLLVSDGEATAGITSDDAILGLAESWGELGYNLTTIGLGESFDVELMRELAELGSGSFYYLEDPAAVEEVFEEEVQAFLIPLAEDAHIDATVFEGYDLRAVYGTKQFELSGNHASIDIPILQIAHRLADDDNESGRRGGGGAMIFELLPNGEYPGEVGRLEFSYRDPISDEMVFQEVDISSPLGPWETPNEGYFSGPSVEKGFVMLNIFVGFRMASQRASVGDDATALSTLRALASAVESWLVGHDDEDITDDLFYVYQFIENLEARATTSQSPNPLPPPEPWPAD